MLYLSFKGEKKITYTHTCCFKKINHDPQFLEDGVPVSKASNNPALLLFPWYLLLGQAFSIMILTHFLSILYWLPARVLNLSPLIFLSTSKQNCQKDGFLSILQMRKRIERCQVSQSRSHSREMAEGVFEPRSIWLYRSYALHWTTLSKCVWSALGRDIGYSANWVFTSSSARLPTDCTASDH